MLACMCGGIVEVGMIGAAGAIVTIVAWLTDRYNHYKGKMR